jgi:ABC-2 type transport system permease protein
MKSAVIPLIKKETREIRRDPYTLGMAIVLPLVLLFLFAYGLNWDIKNISLAVYDMDRSRESRDYISHFESSGNFDLKYWVRSEEALTRLLDEGLAKVSIIIPPDFSRKLTGASSPQVGVRVDGAFTIVAIGVLNYVDAINEAYSAEVLSRYMAQKTGRSLEEMTPIQIEARVWFNPSLESINFFMPGLFAVLLMTFPPLLTALTVVREKERGSLKQLFVSPAKPYEIIIGKSIPYTVIAFAELLLILLVGLYWFQVPMNGSLPLFLVISLVFVFCAVGMGLLISTLVSSQIAAIILVLAATIMPSFLFSGFMFPIWSMPRIMQFYTYLFPARYYVEVTRGIFLKGLGIEYMWSNFLLLAAYTFLIFALASLRFKKKVG